METLKLTSIISKRNKIIKKKTTLWIILSYYRSDEMEQTESIIDQNIQGMSICVIATILLVVMFAFQQDTWKSAHESFK